MDAAALALLAVVALVAGAVNAVAGGGSLLLFPALVAAGLSPLAANVTNTTALWPGYLGAVGGFRGPLAGQRPAVVALGATALLGGGLGAALLLATGDDLFGAVVPYLVVAASLVLAVQPRLTRAAQRLPGAGGLRSPLLHGALLLAGVYGGYFGGLLGVLLLAALAVFLGGGTTGLVALRSVLALLVNTVALVAFALLGPVDWTAVAVTAPAALAGGWAGARVAVRLPADALRWTVVAVGLAAGVALL